MEVSSTMANPDVNTKLHALAGRLESHIDHLISVENISVARDVLLAAYYLDGLGKYLDFIGGNSQHSS
jgi:hypothetical protein